MYRLMEWNQSISTVYLRSPNKPKRTKEEEVEEDGRVLCVFFFSLFLVYHVYDVDCQIAFVASIVAIIA